MLLSHPTLHPFSSLSPTRLNLERHVHQYEYWADKFQQLPMYFMGFYGAVDIITVIEVRVYGCWLRVYLLSLSIP